jgi:hypothetical protein
LETAAVFENVFFGVPFGETKIEKLFAVLIGNAAEFGTEAVDEPGELCEGGHLEDAEALDVALGPGGRCADVEA